MSASAIGTDAPQSAAFHAAPQYRRTGRILAARDRKLVHWAAAFADSPIGLSYPFEVALSGS
jgi:hypothetical protein